MNTAEYVAKQMAKRFTARKIPDLKHVRYCRKHTCLHLGLGFEVGHAGSTFNADWLYEGYQRFRDRPKNYYANDVLPWETILEYM